MDHFPSGASTVAAAFVTVWLARLTKTYVIETEKLRRAAERNAEPLMIGRIEPFGSLYAQYVLTNVGLAPARSVSLRLELASGGVGEWSHRVFEPGRTERFFLPTGNDSDQDRFSTLAAKGERLTARISYDIGVDQNKVETEHVDFKQQVLNWSSAGWHMPDSEMSELNKSVRQGMKDLARAVDGINQRLDGLRHEFSRTPRGSDRDIQ